MRRARIAFILLPAAIFILLFAGCTSVSKETTGDLKTGKKSEIKSPTGQNKSKDKESSATAGEQPTGEQPGKVTVKPLEGELVQPVKRDDDIDIYRELKSKVKFTPLYPGYMPSGFKVADREAVFQASDNGVDGFTIRYQEGQVGVTLMEGSVFTPESGAETEQIKIRTGTAYLETLGDGRYAVFFVSNGTKFGLSSNGLSKEEIRKIATALVSVDELK